MFEHLEIEKNELVPEGKLLSYIRIAVHNREEYSRLEDDLTSIFDNEFPNIAVKGMLAIQELMMNAWTGNNYHAVFEIKETENCVYFAAHGSKHDPKLGYRTPEERGYDPNHKENHDWIKKGRTVETPLGPKIHSWGTICTVNCSDGYAYSPDGRVKAVAFNKKNATSLSRAS